MENATVPVPPSYNASGTPEEAAQRVAATVCLLSPGMTLTAGFDEAGAVAALRYAHQDADLPVWNAESIENAFLNEPLLADPAKIAGIFFADDRLLLVPDSLYQRKTAAAWLRKMQYVAPNEAVIDNPVEDKNLHVLAPFSQAVWDVVGSYFGTPPLEPISAALLRGGSGTVLSVTLIGGYAYAHLQRGARLLWHGAFRYDTPEDVAYRLYTACREHGILAKAVAATGYAATLTEVEILRSVLQYFPAAPVHADGGDGGEWKSITSLMRMLYSCVS